LHIKVLKCGEEKSVERKTLHENFKVFQKNFNAVSTLGFTHTFLLIVKSKLLKDKSASLLLWLATSKARLLKYDDNLCEILWLNRTFYVPHGLLSDFASEISELCIHRIYSFKRKHDIIIDIGGFLGETAFWFLSMRYANRVVVFEPVFYEVCKRNIGDIATVYCYAVHRDKGLLKFNINGIGSRTGSGKIEAKAMSLSEVLDSISLTSHSIAVKMDCEGCEESIIHTPCSVLRKADEWIVEVHPWVDRDKIVEYMKSCGFKASLSPSGTSIYHFLRR
jgi:FkbM family methyltransferase